jgi:hypothetical protein
VGGDRRYPYAIYDIAFKPTPVQGPSRSLQERSTLLGNGRFAGLHGKAQLPPVLSNSSGQAMLPTVFAGAAKARALVRQIACKVLRHKPPFRLCFLVNAWVLFSERFEKSTTPVFAGETAVFRAPRALRQRDGNHAEEAPARAQRAEGVTAPEKALLGGVR